MRNNTTLLFFLAVIALTACKAPRYIYAPAPPNNPYFTQKGESKLAAYRSNGNNNYSAQGKKNNGFDFQGAYALTNNWALIASHTTRKERDIYYNANINSNYFDSSRIDYRRKMTEFGGGYFLPMDSRKQTFFSVYGGLGLGKFSFTDFGRNDGSDYTRSHSSGITKWFIQPGVYFNPGKDFQLAVIGKMSFVHYRDVKTTYTNDEITYFRLDRIPDNTFTFFEPTLNVQIGIPKCDWMKVDGGLTFLVNSLDNDSRLKARGFVSSIGLCFDLTKLNKKASQ